MKNVPQKSSDFDVFNVGWPSWLQAPFFHKAHAANVAIWEEPKEVIVEAAAPGMSPEDIEMDFSKGILTIRGQRKEEKTDEKKKFYQRSDTSFSYQLHIPGDVDEKVEPKAELKEGILKVSFKKREGTHPKKIPVKRAK